MDSKQIKKNLSNEPVFIINELVQQENAHSQAQETNTRKLKGQVIAQPAEESMLSIIDPWQRDSEAIEQQLLVAISALSDSPISNKLELKKKLTGLYNHAHKLMTCYNQRVQSLLMDDRFLYRDSSEISAFMIRGLMPPLEALKTLEKGLTSNKKKNIDEPIEAVQKIAEVELKNVVMVLKESKLRITKYTKPLKPTQIMQKQLQKRLEQEAEALKLKTLESPAAEVSKTTTAQQTVNKSAQPGLTKKVNVTPNDIKTTPLKILALQLNTPESDDSQQSLTNYLEAEYQHFFPLQSLLCIAIKKCDLLGMVADKACKACLAALILIEESILNLKESQNTSLSLEAIGQLDQAIVKLTLFSRKLPGEVSQLLTELIPRSADSRYHLLNILCRKLLLDGASSLTQKPSLSQFKDVEVLLTLLQESADNFTFDSYFLAVFGPIFNAPTLLKNALNILNKPQEIRELLQIFQRVSQSDFEQLSIAYGQAAFYHSPVLSSGLQAYKFVMSEFMESVTAAADSFSLSEPDDTVNNLIQSLEPKLMNFFKALDFLQNQGNKNPGTEDKAVAHAISELTALLTNHVNHVSVMSVIEGLNNVCKHPAQSLQLRDALAICQRNFVTLLQSKYIQNEAAVAYMRQFVYIQSMLKNPQSTPVSAVRVAFPQTITESIKTLQSSMSTRWYNQRFISQVQERRAKTLALVHNLITACEHTVSAKEQIAGLVKSVAQESVKDCDDPLIKQLASAMQNHADEIQVC